MLHVVTQQRKKCSLADITDAHIMAEDWVRGQKRCKVTGSADVHAALYSDKRRRCMVREDQHSTHAHVRGLSGQKQGRRLIRTTAVTQCRMAITQ